MPSPTEQQSLARVGWADLAKGASIVLVVLHHATTKQYDLLVPSHLSAIADSWTAVSRALKPVRMPLFFLVSGFFASRAIHQPWPMVARRIAASGYLYVVWLLLTAAFTLWERELPMNRVQDLEELGLDLLFASTGLWFLYALVVYFVLTKATATLPAAPVLSAATALAVAAVLSPIEEVNRVSVLLHLVFFMVGARLPGVVRATASSTRPGILTALVLGFVGTTALLATLGLPSGARVLVLSVLGLPAGVLLSVRAARTARIAPALSWVGRRTLPVYVLHIPVLGVLHHLGLSPAMGPEALDLPLAVLYPLLVTALVTAGSLLAHAALVRVGLGALFRLPRIPRPATGLAGRSADSPRDGRVILDA
ncbi:acyltransferase [Mycobacterium cookii]|uniref:Acyltransferase n=1 Tax=Nocardioides furvisabuli TaxID=375542 RepID=A0ABP5J8V6_9ACTN|nr:acyltransferase family protein [Nocardioides furvisabuli]